jgi:RimJ/RimL family protein N-acetyltransferase
VIAPGDHARDSGDSATNKHLIAPTVEAERIRLRAVRAEDADAHWAMMADPQVMTFLHGDPMGREDAFRRLLAAPGMWALFGYGYWAIERKSDGRFIGQIGLAQFRRDMEPSLDGLPEAGWMLTSDVHGQGYGREALAAMLEWAGEELPGQQIVAIIAEGNKRSMRLAESAGFKRAELSKHRGDDVVIFRL